MYQSNHHSVFLPFPTFSWVIAVFPSLQQNSFSPLVKIARDKNSTRMKGIFMLPKLSSADQIYQGVSGYTFCWAISYTSLSLSHCLSAERYLHAVQSDSVATSCSCWLVGWMAGWLPGAIRSTRSFSQAACKLLALFHFK